MLEFAILIVIVVGTWLLWDGLKARESANAAMRAACQAHGLLFLDDTVALASLRPARDFDGHACLRRVYRFEYSDTGNNRRRGSITMMSARVSKLDLPLPDMPLPVTLN